MFLRRSRGHLAAQRSSVHAVWHGQSHVVAQGSAPSRINSIPWSPFSHARQSVLFVESAGTLVRSGSKQRILPASPLMDRAFGSEPKKHQSDKEADNPHGTLTSHAA